MVLLPGGLDAMLNATNRTVITCPKCGAEFTFEEGATGAIEAGIPVKAVLCPACGAIHTVEVTPGRIELIADVTGEYT